MSAREPALVEIADVRHISIHGSRHTYCGHPRQGGIFNFGNGELAVIHNHRSSAYERPGGRGHGQLVPRTVVLLQRSPDNGETWPQESDVEIWCETAPLEERRELLFPEDPLREEMDMTRRESVFYFGRTQSGEEHPDGEHGMVCFVLRSCNKGRTWETVPTIIPFPRHADPHSTWLHRDNHPLVRMSDGSFLGALSSYDSQAGGQRGGPGQVLLYGSDDDGLTWEYLAEIAGDATGRGRPTYPGLVLLPSGRLICIMIQLGGRGHFIGMNWSGDGGYSWSGLTPIVRWGHSPWRGRRRPGQYGGWGFFYRSPWPMLLRDGRLLVLFARRKPPYGIGGIMSEDEGKSWSHEFIVRDDAECADLGYPVATELDDGRIFTAYYYNLADSSAPDPTCFLAGTYFRIKG